MGEVIRQRHRRITSSASAAVDSEPVRVGGNLFDVQYSEPTAVSLGVIQVSSDKLNWVTANDIGGTSLTAQASGYFAGIREGAPWARFQVATDSSGPRSFDAIFNIHKSGGTG